MAEYEEHFEIHIDGREYKVHETSMSGAQLKTLAGKDSTYQLFEEVEGGRDDILIPDNQTVSIRSGLRFYTVPSATFGR